MSRLPTHRLMLPIELLSLPRAPLPGVPIPLSPFLYTYLISTTMSSDITPPFYLYSLFTLTMPPLLYSVGILIPTPLCGPPQTFLPRAGTTSWRSGLMLRDWFPPSRRAPSPTGPRAPDHL